MLGKQRSHAPPTPWCQAAELAKEILIEGLRSQHFAHRRLASEAFDEGLDKDLVRIDASHLFESSVAYIGFRRGTFLRRYMLSFIELFAPHLDEWMVREALACKTRQEREDLFAKVSLPQK